MNAAIIKKLVCQTLEDTITFPQVVEALLKEGIESYHADLVQRENRYYMPNGETHVEPVPLAHHKANQAFSATQVKLAIRGIQEGKINYQEFIQQILAAGVVYYIAYLHGKKVIYFGREGDFYIEPFPTEK